MVLQDGIYLHVKHCLTRMITRMQNMRCFLTMKAERRAGHEFISNHVDLYKGEDQSHINKSQAMAYTQLY